MLRRAPFLLSFHKNIINRIRRENVQISNKVLSEKELEDAYTFFLKNDSQNKPPLGGIFKKIFGVKKMEKLYGMK